MQSGGPKILWFKVKSSNQISYILHPEAPNVQISLKILLPVVLPEK
jgi:hypothetical protein